MQTETKELSAEESFRIIEGMIATARNKVAENGFHLLLWGILVISCCLANYFLIDAGAGNLAGLPWLIMPFIGVPVGIVYERIRTNKKEVKTHADLHVKHIWMSYLTGLALLIVFCSITQTSPIPFILILTGVVTFASGKVLQFIPLQAGGVVFWVGALLCLKITGPNQLLIQAITTFLGYIVPGILLWRAYKNNSNV